MFGRDAVQQLGEDTLTDYDHAIEHLKIVQDVINRMAQTSFLLKGWMITVVVAILGVSLGGASSVLGFLALFPVFVFWGLDAYYLRQERLFRGLYELIRQDTEHVTVPLFSMKTEPCRNAVPGWWATVFSRTEMAMYLSTAAVVLVVSLVLLSG